MEIIAAALRDLRDSAIQRRDTAAAEVVAIDDLLALVTCDTVADLVPIAEVRRRLGLGASTIYEMIADGRLPSVHFGRAVRVPLDAVEDLQRHGVTGTDSTGRRPGEPGALAPRPTGAPGPTGIHTHRGPRRQVPARLWHRQ